MKTGRTLVELAQEIERQASAKKDMIVDTRQLGMIADGPNGIALTVAQPDGVDSYPLTQHGLRQVGTHTGIPAAYIDRMAEKQPQLLATNVKTWFDAEPQRRMVRTLDGRARAFLSDRYQRIDNVDVANAVIPALSVVPGLQFRSTEITPNRLYIKAVTTEVQAEIKSRRVGDFVRAGVMISNSEVGSGAIAISPFMEFLVCTNGMVMDRGKFRRNHVGGSQVIEGVYEVLSDEALRADDNATLLKVRDVVAGALDRIAFQASIDAIQETVERRVEGNPVKAVEVLGRTVGLLKGEQTSVLRHLIEGGDLSQYGLMNAVTRASADVEDYDRATELEAMGGRVVSLAPAQWREIAQAA